MAVGSFTSVSLEPPLVAFLPAKSSTTFPRIRETGRFCVNVLSAEQEDTCRSFARSGGSKFDTTPYTLSPGGCPVIDGVVAWIDCDIESISEAGDHYICLGRVTRLTVDSPSNPLVFFRGGYGRLATPSLAAAPADDLVSQLLLVDLARPEMERLATAVHAECIASAVVGDSVVMMAVAGTPLAGQHGIRVGERIPYIPPVGAVFAAWASEEEKEAWLNRLPGASAPQRESYRKALAAVRERGFAFGRRTPRRALDRALAALHVEAPADSELAQVRAAVEGLADTYDPAELVGSHGVEYIGAPIFDHGGRMALQLTVYGFPQTEEETVQHYAAQVLEACARITKSLDHLSDQG